MTTQNDMDFDIIPLPTPPEFDPDEIPDVMEADDTVRRFFEVAERMGDLYVSYRQRFVMMVNGRVFIPKTSKGEYLKLLNKSIFDHLDRKYCVGVYGGPSSAKFLCFDVDAGGLEVVRKIVDYLLAMGIPKESIAVSYSGSKGYHVELFFDGVVTTGSMVIFYAHVMDQLGLDSHKVEFRPTEGQSIKLPLGAHYKTGKMCWYLDLDTLEPIESWEPIFAIRPMDRDAFYKMSSNLPVSKSFKMSMRPDHPAEETFQINVSGDHYPDLHEEGRRFLTMRSIAIYERNQGELSPEQLEQRLRAWVDRQNPDFINDTEKTIENDIRNLVDWVFSPKFKLRGKMCKSFDLTKSDIALCLVQGSKAARRLMFVLVCYAKRYGSAKMAYSSLAKLAGCSDRMAKKLIPAMVDSNYLEYDCGRRYVRDNQLILNTNTYHPNLNVGRYKVPWYEWQKDSYQVTEEFSHDEGWFVKFYYNVLAEMVEARSLASTLTASEIKEMKEITENGKRSEQDDQ